MRSLASWLLKTAVSDIREECTAFMLPAAIAICADALSMMQAGLLPVGTKAQAYAFRALGDMALKLQQYQGFDPFDGLDVAHA